jgi:hypothetical protein
MFSIVNKEYSVIKITVVGTLTLDELKKILAVLTRVFNTKKHFAFYVHCNFTEVPLDITHITKYLINWMKESHNNLVNYLEGSSLIIKNEAIAATLNTVFRIQPTVKPNCITTNYKHGEEFVTDLMKKYLKKINPKEVAYLDK